MCENEETMVLAIKFSEFFEDCKVRALLEYCKNKK